MVGRFPMSLCAASRTLCIFTRRLKAQIHPWLYDVLEEEGARPFLTLNYIHSFEIFHDQLPGTGSVDISACTSSLTFSTWNASCTLSFSTPNISRWRKSSQFSLRLSWRRQWITLRCPVLLMPSIQTEVSSSSRDQVTTLATPL